MSNKKVCYLVMNGATPIAVYMSERDAIEKAKQIIGDGYFLTTFLYK